MEITQPNYSTILTESGIQAFSSEEEWLQEEPKWTATALKGLCNQLGIPTTIKNHTTNKHCPASKLILMKFIWNVNQHSQKGEKLDPVIDVS